MRSTRSAVEPGVLVTTTGLPVQLIDHADWADRHAARDLCDLARLAERGALTPCTPVLTAVVAAWVSHVRIGLRQVTGLLLGVAAVLAALRDRLGSLGTGAVSTVLGFVAGGVHQQRFCRDTDFSTGNAVQHAVSA